MIQDGKIVSISYQLRGPEGDVLDEAQNNDPLQYLHGAGQIIPGLEKALEGKATGYKETVEVAPQDGYGEVISDLQIEVDRSQFPDDLEVKPGLQFTADIGGGYELPFTVTQVEGEKVAIDGNHPLAGKTLHFDVEVHEVRDATKEEMEHGHAHGEDGEEPSH